MPTEITNPRRILLVGGPKSGKLTFLKALTGSLPPTISEHHAGLSHELQLDTAYYKATVGVWVDEIPISSAEENATESTEAETKSESASSAASKIPWDSPSSSSASGPVPIPASSLGSPSPEELGTPSSSSSSSSAAPTATPATSPIEEWTSTYTSELAAEVLSVVGCIIVVFRSVRPPLPVLGSLQKIVSHMERTLHGGWDGVCLAVGMSPSTPEAEAEEIALRHGFEYVPFCEGKRGVRNEFGEPTGMDRVREALEANDWSGDGGEEGEEEEEGGLEGIGGEMEREMAALRGALDNEAEGGEEDVEQLEAIMARLMMVKEMGESLSKEERRRIAAKAVADLMKS